MFAHILIAEKFQQTISTGPSLTSSKASRTSLATSQLSRVSMMITPSSPFTTIINYDHLGYDEDGDGDNNIDNDGDLQHDAVRQAVAYCHIHILTHF